MDLERFLSFLAVVTFVALSIVVSHEWAYFGVIGPELQSLFNTYNYIAQSIVWIGPAFVFSIVVGGVYLLVFRSDNFEFKKVAKSRWGRFLEE